MLIQKTGDLRSGPIKMAIYAPSGTGKTFQLGMAAKAGKKVIIISAENGLHTLAKFKEIGVECSYIDITKDDEGNVLERGAARIARIGELYSYLLTPEAKEKYDLIALDTATEIADSIITSAKANENQKDKPDLRQAYGALALQFSKLVNAFRDLGHYDVVFLLQESLDKDETTGRRYFAPDLPGKASQGPFLASLDSVFRLFKADDGLRYFQTDPSPTVIAKHRGAGLEALESAEVASGGLGALLRKIKGLPPLESIQKEGE